MSTAVQPTLDLYLLEPADWLIVRAARLRALRDSQDAFVSRYEKERRRGRSYWERTFDSGSWMVAQQATQVIGLARTVFDASQPEIRYIESIWVDPGCRRHGVFRAILGALSEAGRRVGVTDLLLWVLEDNHVAQKAYEAVGFETTGCRQFLSAIGRWEMQQQLSIRASEPGEVSRIAKVDMLSANESFQAPVTQTRELRSLSAAADAIYATPAR